MPHSLTVPYDDQAARASAAGWTRTPLLSIVGWAAAFGGIFLIALLWQGFHSAREANRQKIIAALDNAAAEIREQVLVVEMTAQITERVVRAVCPENPACLRTTLETAAAAFVQRPELSHLGLILPEAGAHGHLERAADGGVLMRLYPGDGDPDAVAHSLSLTDTGFAPHHASAIGPTWDADLHRHPVYQTALQGPPEGVWQLRMHPWMLHADARDPSWGISYTKALYDETGSLLGVLDANFDLSAVQPYLDALQTKYGMQLDVIELGDPPRRIGGDAHAPQPILDAFAPLLTAVPDTFAETLTIDDERRWVAARPLTLKGNVAWRVVASMPMPLGDALWNAQRWEMLALVLAITGGAALAGMRLVQRFNKMQGRATEQDLEHLATHDSLTDLPNRMLMQERIALETPLRNAIDAGQLRLVYQPKISLTSGRIVGCEALLRWTHPELGPIPPSRFIPVAEASGLIIPIGDWVLETACREAKSWLDAGLSPVRVAVNLSVGQFLRRDVVAWVSDVLQRTGLPAQCLQLELTESLPPQNLDETIATFEQLQALGVILALDDFGTGYSNLSHLKRFPIHTLKIDQSFVRNAITAPQDAAIVRAVITLAHRLNFKALAEGVETEEQLRFLCAEQCDEIQGYYFSVPLSSDAYAAKLRDGTGLGGMQAG